jgi:NADH-quinone oxidoreductase subunit M
VLGWATAPLLRRAPRWISLISLLLQVLILSYFWTQGPQVSLNALNTGWLTQLRLPWIAGLGVSLTLSLDGLSLLLVALTAFIGFIAVFTAWNEVHRRVGFFHFNLMGTLAAITGVFMATDLFLFYFLWELMLVPMYFLITQWGHEQRYPAANRFFLFTQISALCMLLGILGLYFLHGQASGQYTFDYDSLLGTKLSGRAALWLMLGFFVAFGVKLGLVPLHAWLPDAYTQAPTAGSLILAGLMAKTAAYGMLRFVIPLFPAAAAAFQGPAMILGVISIVYGAVMAFGQSDLKRLIAYSSISHMGFMVLGIFAWREVALQGVVIMMLSHALSAGGLFLTAGALEDRFHSRQLGHFGGLWADAPRMSGSSLLFALATMGLPGLGVFVGEVLILLGALQVSLPLACVAVSGGVFSVIYAPWMIQRLFQGPRNPSLRCADLSRREVLTFGLLIIGLLWLGLYPRGFLSTSSPAVGTLLSTQRSLLPADTLSPPPPGGRP